MSSDPCVGRQHYMHVPSLVSAHARRSGQLPKRRRGGRRIPSPWGKELRSVREVSAVRRLKPGGRPVHVRALYFIVIVITIVRREVFFFFSYGSTRRGVVFCTRTLWPKPLKAGPRARPGVRCGENWKIIRCARATGRRYTCRRGVSLGRLSLAAPTTGFRPEHVP